MGELIGLAVVVMALAIPLVALWTRHRREVLKMQLAASAGRGTQDQARVAELEDRVRVLERIVTDGGYDVANQIEALRDQRRVDELLDPRRQPSAN